MNDSLEKVYRTHRQGLYSYAISIVGSPQLAEDAIHNAFANLYRQRLHLDSEGNHLGNGHVGNGKVGPTDGEGTAEASSVAYIFRTVRNSAIDLCRSSQRRNRLSDVLFVELPFQRNDPTPEQSCLTKERDAILRAEIDNLPEKNREAVMLKLFAGLTFEQAAKVVNESPKTIATRYRRALEKLENQLKGKL